MIITKRQPFSVGEMLIEEFNDLWAALHTPKRMARVERARPIQEVTAGWAVLV
jgi:plasmid maintenance system antidote protein VapI